MKPIIFLLIIIAIFLAWHIRVTNLMHDWEVTACLEKKEDNIGSILAINPLTNKIEFAYNSKIEKGTSTSGLLTLRLSSRITSKELAKEFRQFSLQHYDYYPLLVSYNIEEADNSPDARTSRKNMVSIKTEEEAINHVRTKINKKNPYASVASAECILYYSKLQDGYIDVYLYKDHQEKCESAKTTSDKIEFLQVYPDGRIHVNFYDGTFPFQCLQTS